MSASPYFVSIRKEKLKFSAAHATVFPDGSKESLHGHNFTTELGIEISDVSFEKMVPFSEFKSEMKSICDAWDEKVLLAEKCPFFEIKNKSKTEIEFTLCKKRYVLPCDEVVLLPVDNITAERLSEVFCLTLVDRLKANSLLATVTGIRIRIEEAPGQGAMYFWKGSNAK